MRKKINSINEWRVTVGRLYPLADLGEPDVRVAGKKPNPENVTKAILSSHSVSPIITG